MQVTSDPRDFGLTAADLRATADRLYAPDDTRLEPIVWDHATQVRYGQIRSHLRSLADAIDHEPQVAAHMPFHDHDLWCCSAHAVGEVDGQPVSAP